ncbi:hypothetical protein GGX14DRAFT_646297 [Mycena pura]|uniref:Uncharacterized protein n=1 Tax=Mycena pura TaxID=153505 RepID=A0AAD6VB37_9AGAR|nr:hypothetical protein GGX14DRAFT_646297 [Mycena pura]
MAQRPQPAPASVGPPQTVARSSAIFKSADLLYVLIQDEVAHAVKPYQDSIQDLRRQLALHDANDDRAAALEHHALKAALEEIGFGVELVASRPTFSFVGESATVASKAHGTAAKLLSIDPAKLPPITPSSVVEVLTRCLVASGQRLETFRQRCNEVSKQKDRIETVLGQREEEWNAERATLNSALNEELNKVSALTQTSDGLKRDSKILTVWMLSARAESDELKAKCQVLEAEREASSAEVRTWETRALVAQGFLDAAQGELKEVNARIANQNAELAEWTAKSASWETERQRLKNQNARNASIISADLPRLKTQLQNAETERDHRKAALETQKDAMARLLDLQMKKSLEVQTERDRLKAELETQKDAMARLQDLQMKKSLEVEAERDRLKAELETQKDAMARLQDLQMKKSLEVEAERDRLKAELETHKHAIAEAEALEQRCVGVEAERDRLKVELETHKHAVAEAEALEQRCLGVEAERDRLKVELETHKHAVALEQKCLGVEAERAQPIAKALETPTTAPSSPEVPPSMFIKPRAASSRSLPGKPASPPSKSPASTDATTSKRPLRSARHQTPSTNLPNPPSDDSPPPSRRVAALQGRISGKTSAQSAPKPRAPPLSSSPASAETVRLPRTGPLTTRANSAASSSASPLQSNAPRTLSATTRSQATSSSPAIRKGRSLAFTSSLSGQRTDSAHKRSAPSPLLSDRTKVPRFTKPPTAISTPKAKPKS